MRALVLLATAACGGSSVANVDANVDAEPDVIPDATRALLGTATATDATCPGAAPANATCKTVTIAGCPGIESETITATLAIVPPTGTPVGTIVHFSGGGGEGFQRGGELQYRNASYLQLFVAWTTDWEQTTSAGIKTAACRPATLLKWVFDDASLHAGSRTRAFCGEGFSGGSGQLGYALAVYGMGEYLDYVNELSGPPFARIDLGCDGNAPATAQVCSDTVTMKLPSMLDNWENIASPLTCGATTADAAEIQRWHDDSIMNSGAVYAYPNTRVEYFDCTNNATAVTAMAQLYFDQVMQAGTATAYHCYTAADSCMNENLGTTGNADAVAAMIAGCTPRHSM